MSRWDGFTDEEMERIVSALATEEVTLRRAVLRGSLSMRTEAEAIHTLLREATLGHPARLDILVDFYILEESKRADEERLCEK